MACVVYQLSPMTALLALMAFRDGPSALQQIMACVVYQLSPMTALLALLALMALLAMPSFDVVSEVDKQEIDNAINQARKELTTRFDLKDSKAVIQLTNPNLIELSAEDAPRLKSLVEIVIGKLAKRGIDLRNVERKDPAISPLGHARQELHIKQGLEGEKAKEIIKAIKGLNVNVQSQLQDRQVRVTGKKKDELQAVIQCLRGKDFGVGLGFKNFRD